MVRGLVAGAARSPLPLPLGAELMGYALRRGGADGTLDPLFARGLYLRGGSDLLLVSLDVCLVAVAQAWDVRTRLAARTGIARERIVLLSTHTHSGPETGMGALVAGQPPPPHVEALLAAAVEAGCRAVAAAGPARLGAGATTVAIGRNRRREGAPVDPQARVVRIERADGAPLAVVWLHGCHPTVLGHDNLSWSADWPGAANVTIEAALPGALAFFVLSAHGDVDPRTRGVQDLARPGRSRGESPEVMCQLGREVGGRVAETAAGLSTSADAPIAAASTRVSLVVHGGADEARARDALAARRRAALDALGLASDARARTQELYRLCEECVATLPEAEARERVARVRLYLRDRLAPSIAGARSAAVEVQALRLGESRWLALPLEPTVRVGLDWTARCTEASAAVLSIANGWLRYLPHPEDFDEPQAHQGYEVLSSTFVPDAATRLLDAGQDLLSL